MIEVYRVVRGSRLGHSCCFDFTVVDARDDSVVCECFDEDTAKRICEALSAMTSPSSIATQAISTG